MRVLQIGLGRWGQNHLRAWRRLGVELRVVDSDLALFAELPEPGATEAGVFLDQADAVDIVTPAGSHAALVQRALVAGKHVFVEKPLATQPEEAFRIAGGARPGPPRRAHLPLRAGASSPR